MEFLKNLFQLFTAPFWLPGVWIGSKLSCMDSGIDKVVRIVLQTIATIISSLIYLFIITNIFSGEVPERDDAYYERQQYYERKYEPGW